MNSLHLGQILVMMTSSNGTIFRVTGHLCGEFTGPGEFPAQRPVTRSFDVFFDLRLNKRLSKQSWGWWFETLSRSLWSHRNGSGNGLSFVRHQAITWTNAGVLSIQLDAQRNSNQDTNSSFWKMYLKMSSTKCQPFCSSLNVFQVVHESTGCMI